MDINTPIEITEKSTGLDLLNEVRRRFSIYLYQEMQKVLSVPVVDNSQAKTLSRHLTQRIGAMQMLTVIDSSEVAAAVQCIQKNVLTEKEPVAIIFQPINESNYSSISAADMMVIWSYTLQELFTHCMTTGAAEFNKEEQDRLYCFAENAVMSWYDMQMLTHEEMQQAQEIIKNFRDGHTTTSLQFARPFLQ